VISIAFEQPDESFVDSDCEGLLGGQWEPVIHATAHTPGVADVQVLAARGIVHAETSLQAAIEDRIELQVWRSIDGDREQLMPEVVDGVPTWTLQVGEVASCDSTILDSASSEMIGYGAVKWTSSDPEVLATVAMPPFAEGRSRGRAELVAETPNQEHRFAFVVEDPSAP
jgi:hypothetical protein